MSLISGIGGKIPISTELVFRVVVVPMGRHPVMYQPNIDATNSIFHMLEIHDGKQPTLASAEKQLGPTYPVGDDYLRKFIIYMVSFVFAPTIGIHVSPKCYLALINTEAIPRLNLAKFIIDILI